MKADVQATGRENLLFSARLYDVAASDRGPRVDDALRFMGLEAAADKLVKTYSGGMRRRLDLAGALVAD